MKFYEWDSLTSWHKNKTQVNIVKIAQSPVLTEVIWRIQLAVTVDGENNNR